MNVDERKERNISKKGEPSSVGVECSECHNSIKKAKAKAIDNKLRDKIKCIKDATYTRTHMYLLREWSVTAS